MQVTVTIQAPELTAAIYALAGAIGGQNKVEPLAPIQPTVIPAPAPVPPAASMPGGVPMQTPPAAMPPPIVPPVGAAPIQQPMQTPIQTPPPAAVPTAAQTYTMEQLAVSATQLVDAGRRNDLVNLLAQFGVQALTQLPKEQYGNFATQLRALGAKI